jgi:Ca2+-binding RTX toxin-like protein
MKLDGGAGNDTLVTGPAGAANLLGGADADVMASSAGCCAVASYGDHD